MYDTADQVWMLLLRLFPGRMLPEYRDYVGVMMDPASSREDRAAVRAILENALGIDPMFEVQWARAVAENPDIDRSEVRDDNRRLFYTAWYDKTVTTDERNEAREDWEDVLGRDPFVDDGPMRDWES